MDLNVPVVYKILSFIIRILWRNENIIYVNSNKKTFAWDYIDSVTKTKGYKWLTCESNTKLGYKLYNLHLIKMKKDLYVILKKSREGNDLVYAGFVSPMFAVYDGYCIGDARNITFVDLNSSSSAPYKIDYKKHFIKNEINKISKESVNVVFECSNSINGINADYKYSKRSGDAVSLEYLQDVYSFTKSVLDSCLNCGVKSINFYLATKQPVSFVIGTAIQSYHPSVYVYELVEGKYVKPLIIQSGKLGDD